MSKCPVCYNNLASNKCASCGLEMTELEMLQLKASTYDSIIAHLTQSCCDGRRREQARTKIALRNIKRWAEDNLASLLHT
jgi:hypothetical protein